MFVIVDPFFQIRIEVKAVHTTIGEELHDLNLVTAYFPRIFDQRIVFALIVFSERDFGGQDGKQIYQDANYD